MNSKQLLREARLQVLGSYVHKAVLILIAGLGFGMLAWLGRQQNTERKFRETSWQVPRGLEDVVREAVAAVSGVRPGKDEWPCAAAPSFGSREQLILGMGNQAEACVWKRFGETVKAANQNLEAAGQGPPTGLSNVADFADFIGKEEALARITARAARNYVVARLSSATLSPRKAPREEGGGSKSPSTTVTSKQPSWRNGLDGLAVRAREASADDSELHVAYELLWYASLLVGVLASSLLIMTLLMALPITGSEGPWTKRIAEILARVPTPDRKTIAVPLMAAAIGGGTLVGAMAGTRPGGQGRPDHDPLTINSAAKRSGAGDPSGAAGPSIYQWIDRRDETNTNTSTTEPGWPPPRLSLESANASLRTMSANSWLLVQAAHAVNRTMSTAFSTLAGRIDEADGNAAATKVEVAALRADVSRIEADLRQDLGGVGPLVKGLGILTATVARHEEEIARASRVAVEIDDRQKLSLAQGAETDPRRFFARTFERRLYRPGPLVPGIVSALFKDVTSSPEVVEAFAAALIRMRGTEAKPEQAFEKRLRDEIEKDIGADEAMRREAKRVLDLERPALLKLCRVPPY